MPHYSDAAGLPAFPDDVATADLPVLSLAKLLANDTHETAALLAACRSTGFFHLDLRDDAAGAALLDTVDPVFGLAESLLGQPLAEKQPFAFKPGQGGFGYKAVGTSKVDAAGTPDQCEFWAVSKDDILHPGASGRSDPAAIDAQRPRLEDFVRRNHALVELLCARLDAGLGLPHGTLAARQRLEQRSGGQVRMIKYAPQAGGAPPRTSLLAHTDLGTVTVLYNVLGGLQVLAPGGAVEDEGAWRFVAPRRGCAVVNMGDAMPQWTNGALRSAVHRVTAPPGAQARCTRYSVAYFARAEYQATLAPLEQSELIRELTGGVPSVGDMTAQEWEKQKGMAYRVGVGLAGGAR